MSTRAPLKPTPAEATVLSKCRQGTLFYGALFGLAGTSLAALFVPRFISSKRKLLKTGIYVGIGTLGFLNGIAYYTPTCMKMMMGLKDSPIAEEIKQYMTPEQLRALHIDPSTVNSHFQTNDDAIKHSKLKDRQHDIPDITEKINSTEGLPLSGKTVNEGTLSRIESSYDRPTNHTLPMVDSKEHLEIDDRKHEEGEVLAFPELKDGDHLLDHVEPDNNPNAPPQRNFAELREQNRRKYREGHV